MKVPACIAMGMALLLAVAIPFSTGAFEAFYIDMDVALPSVTDWLIHSGRFVLPALSVGMALFIAAALWHGGPAGIKAGAWLGFAWFLGCAAATILALSWPMMSMDM